MPTQQKEPVNPTFSSAENTAIDKSVQELVIIGAIQECTDEVDQFVSTIFTVPKQDGSRRPIINLKNLNQFIESPHFKMEDFRLACILMKKDSFMAVIDQKDAYHLVPINKSSQKYLKFRWNNKLYKYVCLPFGLNIAPYIFTKLMKPVMAHLRSQGHQTVSYLDDCYVTDISASGCLHSVNSIIDLYTKLGLLVNFTKSQLQPSKCVKFLGFLLDSRDMSVTLPPEKKDKILIMIKKAILKNEMRIESVAQVIGTLVAASPGVPYSNLYIRQLEIEKTLALKRSQGNFKANITLTHLAKEDLEWWKLNIPHSKKIIAEDKYDLTLFSDASLSGYGSVCGDSKLWGHWSEKEKLLHINELELLALFFALKHFVKGTDKKVLCYVDNKTAVSYINKLGGCRSQSCFRISKNIWKWCEARSVWLKAVYIKSKDNFEADALSRIQASGSDFTLLDQTFAKITTNLGSPTIDLFATAHSCKVSRFVSWLPDPHSCGTDAFTIPWKEYFYAFPPFSLVGRVLKKIQTDKCTGILVAPYWPTQAWYPLFRKMVVSELIVLSHDESCLYCSVSRKPHSLNGVIRLMAAVVSSKC